MFSLSFIAKIALAILIIFVIGVFARIAALQRRSKEIEKTLDYSKMREWEEDDDDN